jgi:hypothetical protein
VRSFRQPSLGINTKGRHDARNGTGFDTIAKSERADSPGKGRLQLALWQLNLLRVGYLVMVVGLAVYKWPLLFAGKPWGLAEGTVECLLGDVDPGIDGPTVPPADASHPAVRGRVEADLARSRSRATVVGRPAGRRHSGTDRKDPRGGINIAVIHGATCSLST